MSTTKNLKVLLAPNNSASMPSFLLEALNELPGVEARGVFLGKHKYMYESDVPNSFYIPSYSKRTIFHYLFHQTRFIVLLIRHIFWADVIHYVWDSALWWHWDIKLAKRLGKVCFIEWIGSDIRIPEIAQRISPFTKAVYSQPGFEYKEESLQRSTSNQNKFAEAGFIPLTYPELELYLLPNLFPKTYFTSQRLPVTAILPKYPEVNPIKPLLIHSPSAPILKGTPQIVEAIDKLRAEFSFEFILLQNLPREEVLRYMKECDIFIDQIIFGAYGLAACEAMAHGKPVVCYLAEEVRNNSFPKDECPIVNANPDTIYDQLKRLLSDPLLRHNIGIQSRQYAEKYHDAHVVAKNNLNIYTRELHLKEG